MKLLTDVGLYTNQVRKALEEATKTHGNATRDDGKSYLEQHIFPITSSVYSMFKVSSDVETAVTVALLHDVPEDTDGSEEKIFREFGPMVASLVSCLQKQRKQVATRSQHDKYEEHVELAERLQKAPLMARTIKLLDRLNNLVCTEVDRNTEKYMRYVNDTEELYYPIAIKTNSELAQSIKNELTRLKRDLHT